MVSLDEALRMSREKDILEMNNLRERLIELEKRARNIDFVVDNGKVIVIGVLIVFFVAFLGFVVDAWRFHATTYNEYQGTVQSLKDEIQKEREEQVAGRLEKIQQEIDGLWKNKYPIRK